MGLPYYIQEKERPDGSFSPWNKYTGDAGESANESWIIDELLRHFDMTIDYKRNPRRGKTRGDNDLLIFNKRIPPKIRDKKSTEICEHMFRIGTKGVIIEIENRKKNFEQSLSWAQERIRRFQEADPQHHFGWVYVCTKWNGNKEVSKLMKENRVKIIETGIQITPSNRKEAIKIWLRELRSKLTPILFACFKKSDVSNAFRRFIQPQIFGVVCCFRSPENCLVCGDVCDVDAGVDVVSDTFLLEGDLVRLADAGSVFFDVRKRV